MPRGHRFKSLVLHHPATQFPDISENHAQSARMRAIFDSDRTWRAFTAAPIARICQNPSGRDLPRSDPRGPGADQFARDHARRLLATFATINTESPSHAAATFTNLSGDPQQEYFSDGITGDIIIALSRSPDLFVDRPRFHVRLQGQANPDPDGKSANWE